MEEEVDGLSKVLGFCFVFFLIAMLVISQWIRSLADDFFFYALRLSI